MDISYIYKNGNIPVICGFVSHILMWKDHTHMLIYLTYTCIERSHHVSIYLTNACAEICQSCVNISDKYLLKLMHNLLVHGDKP